MSKKILVTGGAGFIGSNLCNFLLKNDCVVYCIDNFATGLESNIVEFKNNDNFHFFKHDIIQPIDIDAKFDIIINLACPASPIQYQKNPIQTMKSSVLGIYNLIDIALKNNSYLIHASTSEVYGDPNIHPQNESYWGNVNPLGIRSCYDEGKRASESIIYDFVRKESLSASILRIFNTYGPNMTFNDGRVVSNFIISALRNDNLIINGDGNQTRCFCYIDDLISAIYALIDNPGIIPVNIGSTQEISIVSLASKIINLTNSKSNIVHSKSLKDDPMRRKPDISFAKSNLGWSPSVSIDDGLIKTIQYFKNKIYEPNTAKN